MSTKKISLDQLEITSFVTTSKILGGGCGGTSFGVCNESDIGHCETDIDCRETSPLECGSDPEFCC